MSRQKKFKREHDKGTSERAKQIEKMNKQIRSMKNMTEVMRSFQIDIAMELKKQQKLT